VPRPRAGFEGRKSRLGWNQFAAFGVEAVDQDFVQSEIANESELIRGIKCYAMRVRTFLTLVVDAFAGVLNKVGGLTQPAIRPTRTTATLPLL